MLEPSKWVVHTGFTAIRIKLCNKILIKYEVNIKLIKNTNREKVCWLQAWLKMTNMRSFTGYYLTAVHLGIINWFYSFERLDCFCDTAPSFTWNWIFLWEK